MALKAVKPEEKKKTADEEDKRGKNYNIYHIIHVYKIRMDVHFVGSYIILVLQRNHIMNILGILVKPATIDKIF